MNWSRIKCAVLGHTWRFVQAKPGHMSGRMGGARKCDCCGLEWEGIKYPPMPPYLRRQDIRATKERAAPIIGKRTEIRDYSYHAEDGSLHAVSIRKADGEQPTICINGVNYPLGWLNDGAKRRESIGS